MELENIYWSLFKGSGSVQVYLAYKELCATDKYHKYKSDKHREDNDLNT